MNAPHIPLLAAELIETLFALIFFGIAFIGWIVNLVSNVKNGQKPARRGANGDARRKQVQSEIEQFLGQNRREPQPQQRPPEQRAPQRPAPPQRKARQDVWAEQSGGGSSQPAPKQKQKQRKADNRSGQQPVGKQGPRPVSAPAAQQGQQPRSLGGQLTPSMSSGMQQHLPHQVDASVASHLGAFKAEAQDSTGNRAMADTLNKLATPSERLAQLLRTSQGVRQAILLNEVLARPKALRR